jgi:hypothetical protein
MTIEELQLYFYGFIFILIFFFIGYLLDPIKRARILRTITGRNYGVVVIRGKGGQTVYKVHDFNKPTFEHGKGDSKKTYSIIEESEDKVYVDHAGNVPIIYFGINETIPYTLLQGSTKKIPPENVESIIMLIKARSEAKAQLSLKTIQLLIIICAALTAVTLLLVFLTYKDVGATRDLVMQAANITVKSNGGFSFT